jgi:hypothetical protein
MTGAGTSMNMKPRVAAIVVTIIAVAVALNARQGATSPANPPALEEVQPELFGVTGGQPAAWADYDNDDDLDLFVGFREGVANRLYRNEGGKFTEVAASAGLADTADTRAAAWGDYDGDGNVDLYVGFTRRSKLENRLYRNDGKGRFTDVAKAMAVDAVGETRQPSWVDYDNDGDLDLFVAFRDAPNMLFRNDGERFVSVAAAMGLDDARRTVGAVWFDIDDDGDLDVFVANQNGDLNGLFRNDGTKFVDVAGALGMDAAGRAPTSGSNGPSVADYDSDGDLDLFVASYGPNLLYRNDGKGRFTEVAASVGLAGGDLATPSRWGDYDNDGSPDLYVSSYVGKPVNERDYVFRNERGRFVDVTPETILKRGATHAVQWIDFDRDGDVDLSLANNNPAGANRLYRNMLPPDRAWTSVQVIVVDANGRATKPGAEVRLYAAGTRTLVGTALVDSGGGYCSQNVAPLHFGVPGGGAVDVEVTSMGRTGRKVTRLPKVRPQKTGARIVVVKVPS